MDKKGYTSWQAPLNQQGSSQPSYRQTHIIQKSQHQNNSFQAPTTSQQQSLIHSTKIFTKPPKLQQIPQTSHPPSSISFTPHKKPPHKKNLLYTLTLMAVFYRKIKRSIKRKKHRQKILQQWYNTQCSYNLDLNIAINLIKKPMESANIITKDQALLMFPQFQGMIQLSNMMIDSLTHARTILNPNQILLGKALNQFVNGYKIYGGYFGSHGKSSKLLSQLPQTHQLQMKKIQNSIHQQLLTHNSKKSLMTIKDCMQQPLYRLFKYILLLKQYIKKLPQQHPDYPTIHLCHNQFHQINNFNNQLMKKLQDQQKKVKLDKYFGQCLRQNRILIAEMQASTIYFNAKLYLFQDIIIITKLQAMLGGQKQQKYANFLINQFSYVSEQQDLKYFKNILILIGQQQCIHLFFPDYGSKSELYKCLLKIFHDLRIKQYEKRKYGDPNKATQTKKLSFTLQQKTLKLLLQPQFCIQIIGIQVRPLSKITNDTAYITRFMIPYYYQDQTNFLQIQQIPQRKYQSKDFRYQSFTPQNLTNSLSYQHSQKLHSLPFNSQYSLQLPSQKLPKTNHYKPLNQHIQIHFSILLQIYNTMKSICPDKLPQIDPITKDINIYSKGKGKTKFYQMRKIFIQQFFNFIFRHPAIMNNPIWFISKLRINEDLWNYCIDRNTRIKQHQKGSQKKFAYDHCAICKKGKINSLNQFQHYRIYYNSIPNHRANKQSDKYCFNFFNLLRTRLLSFNIITFNTLQRILLFYHYLLGRLDYPFLIHHCNDQHSLKLIKIHLVSVDQLSIPITIDNKSTVGQIIDQLGNMYQIKCCFDFDLMAMYNGKNRLLQRDQYLIDVIKCLAIQHQDITQDKKDPTRYTDTKLGFFQNIKKWGKQILQQTQIKNRIIFIKTTYLHKSLQQKSFSLNPKKKQLEIQKIYWLIKNNLIKLSIKQFIQLSSLYYCIKYINKIQQNTHTNTNNISQKINNKLIYKIIPQQYYHIYQCEQKLKKQLNTSIQKQINNTISKHLTLTDLHNRILNIVSQKIDYITYFIQVQPKNIPIQHIENKIMPLACLIGVNYKNFIITRTEITTTPLVILPIDEIEWWVSVFSIFIVHDNKNYRFDGKMVFNFGQMVKKYQIICKKFPQHFS